jgi:hypothetical protein
MVKKSETFQNSHSTIQKTWEEQNKWRLSQCWWTEWYNKDDHHSKNKNYNMHPIKAQQTHKLIWE